MRVRADVTLVQVLRQLRRELLDGQLVARGTQLGQGRLEEKIIGLHLRALESVQVLQGGVELRVFCFGLYED